jgi:hypothetical protein
MHRVLRTWTVWLMVFMLPLQAMASSLVRCENSRGAMPALGIETSAAQGTDGSAEQSHTNCHGVAELPSHGACSACAACCAPCFVPAFVSTAAAPPTVQSGPHFQQPKPAQAPRDALERPPRSRFG